MPGVAVTRGSGIAARRASVLPFNFAGKGTAGRAARAGQAATAPRVTPAAPAPAPAINRTAAAAPLWLHLHLPYLPLETLTRGVDTGRACVLCRDGGRRPTILLANRHAARLGIRPGMPLGAAHALGDLTVLRRHERAEQQALERLCLWAMQFTPMVSPVAPDGLLLEIRGSLKLFGGLDGLLKRLRSGLRQLGYRVDYAVAPTPLAAGLLARTRPREIVPVLHQLQPALARVPVAALRLEPAALAALDSLGIRYLGECRRLPRDGLARRLSPALVDTLDRVFGQAPDPRQAFSVPRSFSAELDLPWEVDNAQALVTAGERLLRELTGYLTANAALSGHLRWRLCGRDNAVESFDIRLTRATRDISHMLLLLRETLARKTLRGPVRAIALSVTDIRFSPTPVTRDLFLQMPQGSDSEGSYAAFVDRLRSRCGEAALRSLGIRSAHDPERAWCWQRVVDVPQRRQRSLCETQTRRLKRPVWLLKQPLRLKSRQGQPMLAGPLSLTPDRERIVSGWWQGAEVARDYFVATNQRGGRLWIFRELDGARCWYLHGIFE